jgi:hypothetical protein
MKTCAVGAMLFGGTLVNGNASAAIATHESYASFASASGTALQREDWSTVTPGILEGQSIGGLTYSHSDAFGHQLAVGNGGGWGFRLGVTMPSGPSNFGWSDKITIAFDTPGVTAVGVLFAQGNYSSTGTSVFAIQLDGGDIYYRSVPVNSFGANVGYLGLTGLTAVRSMSFWQVGSGGDAAWSALQIDYAFVPSPGFSMLLMCAAGKACGRRRN